LLEFEITEAAAPLEIDGIRLATAAAGIRYRDRDDVLLIELDPAAASAAVFTRNKFCAAPVVVAKEHMAAAVPRYLIFNSGNANAGTGKQGLADARAVPEELAARELCAVEQVLPFSTGVIGERLDSRKIVKVLPDLLQRLRGDQWPQAAAAIMTTDTVAKISSLRIAVGGETYRVTGITKGSGMIRPDMATMLAFVATDADIPTRHLQRILTDAVEKSFNRIDVDGDTSTNDACVLTATAKAGKDGALDPDHPHWAAVVAGIERVCTSLAQSIVRDGEGATKFVEVVVDSPNVGDSLAIASTIAQSPLVKTALFASDPNWGRILAAVGRAPVDSLAIDEISIWLDDHEIVRNGEPSSDYRESEAKKIMSKTDITIRVKVGQGGCVERVWTCDLSFDYVRINAEYRS